MEERSNIFQNADISIISLSQKSKVFAFSQVPLTVAELARTTFAVPTTVEDLVSSNLVSSSNLDNNNDNISSNCNLSTSSNLLLTTANNNNNNSEATTPLTINTTDGTNEELSTKNENRSSGSLDSLARSMKLEPVVTSLPPLPRSLPPNLPKKSNSGILREEEIIAFMDPVSKALFRISCRLNIFPG